jgi:hypothetical protein
MSKRRKTTETIMLCLVPVVLLLGAAIRYGNQLACTGQEYAQLTGERCDTAPPSAVGLGSL